MKIALNYQAIIIYNNKLVSKLILKVFSTYKIAMLLSLSCKCFEAMKR